MATIGARLERLPFSRFHAGLLVMGGLGYTFEAMNQAIVAFVLTVVSKPGAWNLTSVETGLLGGVFGVATAVLLADALAVILLGIPTQGRSLERIAADEAR